jgi:hypothetical protein
MARPTMASTRMDTSIVPLLFVAFLAAIASTWIELRNSLKPAICDECPHCQAIQARQRQEAAAEARRQRELSSWYARRTAWTTARTMTD